MKNKKIMAIGNKMSCGHEKNITVLIPEAKDSGWAWQSKYNSLGDVKTNTLALQVQLSNLLQSNQVKDSL